MRILLVIESGTWADDHLAGSLADDGHLVDVFHYGAGVGEFYPSSQRKLLADRNASLLQRARELASGIGLDLIFCYVYDDFLLPETARALQRLDVPMVNYNVDMANQWYRQTRTARYFTRMLCAQRQNMHLMGKYNRNVCYFPMAGRWSRLAGDDRLASAPDVAFMGTPTPYRARVLSELIASGVPCAIFGKFWREGQVASAATGREKLFSDLRHYAWPKLRAEGLVGLWRAAARRIRQANGMVAIPTAALKGVVPQASVGPLLRGAAINLGFTRSGESDTACAPTQLKLRDFEVPLAGGFYLVEHVPEYAEHFRIGDEVDTWRTAGDLAEKARYYLAHPESPASHGARRP
jgi:hypothetical protein